MRSTLVLLFVAATAACSSAEDTLFNSGSGSTGGAVCVAGQQIVCGCPGAPDGFQICNDDGSGYGACSCGMTSSSSSSGGGAGGGTTGTGTTTGAGGDGGDGGAGGGGVCAPGATEPCYSGPAGTDGVGVCVAGTRTCLPDGSDYGPCTGEITPTPETCATPGDEDCDGAANEEGPGCSCAPGTQSACYSGPPSTENVGPCHGGVQQCNAQGTGYGPCVGELTPAPETCNTPEDDDCDGTANEDGAGCACAPGSQATCYEGPPGTENVGVCVGGTKTCNAMGTAYGSCAGQVLPSPDQCATLADDDCSGSNAPCVNAIEWSKAFGASPNGQTAGLDIAVDGAGNVIFLVPTAQNVDFGTGPVSGSVVAKLDALGAVQWVKALGANANDVGVDGAGNVLVTGLLANPTDFGGGTLSPSGPGSHDAFLVKLSAAGNHVWSKSFGGGGGGVYTHGTAVTADASGNVIFAGTFAFSVSFGGPTLTNANNGDDLFVVKLTAAGAHVWSRQGSAIGGSPLTVSADAQGSVVVTGRFGDSLDFGTGVKPGAGGNDLFVAKLDAAGTPVFVSTYGDAQNQMECRSALDPAGNILLTGPLVGTVDFGGGPLVATPAGDIFAAKLTGAGAHVWSKSFGNGFAAYGGGVGVDPAGNVFLSGAFAGSLSFGGAPLVSAGAQDVYVTKLAPAGTFLWSERFGAAQDQLSLSLAVDGTGAPVLTGYVYNAIDFGQGPLVAQGQSDAFVAKLAP